MTGPPSAICLLNRGITDPFDPNTLPNLTATNSVLAFSSATSIGLSSTFSSDIHSVNSGGIRINHVEVLKGIATKSNSGGIHVGLVDSVEAYSITSHTNSGGNNLYGLTGKGEKTINATANSGGINYTFDVQ